MKHPRLLTALALLASALPAFAQLNIPAADGTDGPFSPTGPNPPPIDLSLAIPGDALTFSNTPGNQGRGIYDAARWVIVFKYSSVNVPPGTTVTFTNHPSYAPVVWLVQGSCNIAGTVNVDGKPAVLGTAALTPTEPGPGGFRGGAYSPGLGAGVGLGPGGSSTYNTSYGNPQILPLIGGSGGTGGGSNAYSGNGAGGAILIAAPGTIQIGGSVVARGGINFSATAGSGGGIKLVADQVTGAGVLNAETTGRVRIEANVLSASIVSTPSTIRVAPGTTPTLFQSPSSPTVKIVSVDGLPSPADPTAPLVSSADIAIQKNTPVTIVLETRNFATAGAVVAVRIINKYAGGTIVNATLDAGGNTTLSTWRLSTTLSPGFVTLQARATQP